MLLGGWFPCSMAKIKAEPASSLVAQVLSQTARTVLEKETLTQSPVARIKACDREWDSVGETTVTAVVSRLPVEERQRGSPIYTTSQQRSRPGRPSISACAFPTWRRLGWLWDALMKPSHCSTRWVIPFWQIFCAGTWPRPTARCKRMLESRFNHAERMAGGRTPWHRPSPSRALELGWPRCLANRTRRWARPSRQPL